MPTTSDIYVFPVLDTKIGHQTGPQRGQQRSDGSFMPVCQLPNQVDCRGYFTKFANSRRSHDMVIRTLKRFQEFRFGLRIAVSQRGTKTIVQETKNPAGEENRTSANAKLTFYPGQCNSWAEETSDDEA